MGANVSKLGTLRCVKREGVDKLCLQTWKRFQVISPTSAFYRWGNQGLEGVGVVSPRPTGGSQQRCKSSPSFSFLHQMVKHVVAVGQLPPVRVGIWSHFFQNMIFLMKGMWA